MTGAAAPRGGPRIGQRDERAPLLGDEAGGGAANATGLGERA